MLASYSVLTNTAFLRNIFDIRKHRVVVAVKGGGSTPFYTIRTTAKQDTANIKELRIFPVCKEGF